MNYKIMVSYSKDLTKGWKALPLSFKPLPKPSALVSPQEGTLENGLAILSLKRVVPFLRGTGLRGWVQNSEGGAFLSFPCGVGEAYLVLETKAKQLFNQ